jgi:phthalate 4,5-dioxygenase oxygenase subunit
MNSRVKVFAAFAALQGTGEHVLSAQDNEFVTQVGPGTPMGEMLREYWIPGLLSEEVPDPDSDPRRIMLLGEQLVAFRDTSGRVGVIGNLCPHRGASLFFGRNEENGIRCVYHGWKFDVTGACVDMPNEPAESNFKSRVKAAAYPTRERGGLVWVYMGHRETPPELPDFEANPEGGQVSAVMRDCNWLQALEGDIDTAHFGFLHLGAAKLEDTEPGTMNHYAVKTRSPKYMVVDTDFGAMYTAYRPAEDGEVYWRTGQYLFPFYTHIPTGVMGREIRTRAWVPLDDNHTLYIYMSPKPHDPSTERRQPGETRYYAGSALQPDSTDWFGRYRYVPDGSNDYLIDREAQRSGRSFTGIESVPLQDQAVCESMGPVLNRELEHLGTSDLMVVRVRNLLREAAIAHSDKKVVPPGVEDPHVYRVRSGGVILPEAVPWPEGIQQFMPAYVDDVPIDDNGRPTKLQV